MLKQIKEKRFRNGIVYALETEDGYPIEVTDTFLPFYTKDAIGRKQNVLHGSDVGSRLDRWMIGVSVTSGCPVGCKFCATANLPRCRNLRSDEILNQIQFILDKNPDVKPGDCQEFKINYTRMGEPFLNLPSVKAVILQVSNAFQNTHHYVSTIGVKDSDFSWIKDNITLQFSIHSFDEPYRNWLIPYPHKMSLEEIGKIRTESKLKTTLNLTLASEGDFSIQALRRFFSPKAHFVKLSPINPNCVSDTNGMGSGVITQTNLI